MPEATKNSAQILADQAAFKAAYERARAQFEAMDGVAGVGYGLKQRQGVFGSDLAIVVFVQEKKAPGNVPAGQMIPASFEGYATDVRVVPQAISGACDNTAKYTTIQGGIQIANKGQVTVNLPTINESLEPGTVACVVRKRNAKPTRIINTPLNLSHSDASKMMPPA